jgi:aminoglycoside phosphotransferase (APT) family kinase protein
VRGPAGAQQPDVAVAVRAACDEAGITSNSAELIRAGENAVFRLADQIVIRVGRPGQEAVAEKEVAVARWLEKNHVPAVRTAPEVLRQPLVQDGRPVTFWRELPPHRHGSPREIAAALRRLHSLPPPSDFRLHALEPMTRLPERIEAAATLGAPDQQWLRHQVNILAAKYARLPEGLPHSVVHCDAWAGNVVVTPDHATVFLDLERFSIGPPEWDLVSTAIKHGSFAWITAQEYAEFVEVYGRDVTSWSGFEILRDIRELRMTCYSAQQATRNNESAREARKRVDSIRGLRGPRPWPWKPAP